MNTFEEKVFDEFENEIKLYYCGKRFRSISHRYGPYEYKRYLIYFIKEGRAELTLDDGKAITLSKGFFVNFPESGACYSCEEGTPWTIKWIVADGIIIERYLSLLGITREKPYIPLKEESNVESIFDEMYEYFDKNLLSSKIYCISLVHRLFAALAEDMKDIKTYNDYVAYARKLIEENYSSPEFNVSRLARALGLHHNYFSILYKKETGEAPMKAINKFRLQNASKMLRFTDKPIKEVARDSGFSDELYFSRVFKNAFGVSPSVYRRSKNVKI